MLNFFIIINLLLVLHQMLSSCHLIIKRNIQFKISFSTLIEKVKKEFIVHLFHVTNRMTENY